MNEQVVVPGWAVAVLLAAVAIIVAIARWGVKYLADRVEADIRELQTAVKESAQITQNSLSELRDRVTRMEGIKETVNATQSYLTELRDRVTRMETTLEIKPRRQRVMTPAPLDPND